MDSPYDRLVFAPGTYLLGGVVTVAKPGLHVVLAQGAMLSPGGTAARIFDVHAPGVTLSGSGTFDGAARAADPGFDDFIMVRNSADGFHLVGDAKPTATDQTGALHMTHATHGIVVDGADNVILERLDLQDFNPGTYGIVLRDLGAADGHNADGGTGSVVRDIFARGGQGGGLPGAPAVNGAWIRLDTSGNGAADSMAQLTHLRITDNILQGGTGGQDAAGRQYYFVNIDSNIEQARDITIAYNTLRGAASYEIQIKNGYPNPHGVRDVWVHDNLLDHADADLLRHWPLKVQSNYDAPMQVAFENNLALLQPGRGRDDIFLGIGFVDGVESRGDFLTDRARVLIRGQGAETPLTGTPGDDWLLVQGADRVTGGAGHDLFDIRAGDGIVMLQDFDPSMDQLRLAGFGHRNILPALHSAQGQAGLIDLGYGDRVIVQNAGQALDLSTLHSGQVFVTQTWRQVDAVAGQIGGAAADRVTGGAGADRLHGGGSGDILTGLTGADWLYGGAGADLLIPGADTDRMWGGTGADDFVLAAGSGLNIVYDFAPGQDRIALRGTDFAALRLDLYAGRDAQIHTPDGARLVLRAIDVTRLDSDDFVLLGAGNGADLIGGAGRDNLHGTFGADTFVMTPGTDRHYGDAGADVFVFTPGSGLNIIYDYETGLDRIGLDGVDATTLDLFMYNARDAEIRTPQGDRIVLRDVDVAQISDADFWLL